MNHTLQIMPELKYLAVIGFAVAFMPNYDVVFESGLRILSSIVGTILAGTLWVFLKPPVTRLRNRLANYLKKRKK